MIGLIKAAIDVLKIPKPIINVDHDIIDEHGKRIKIIVVKKEDKQ